MSNRAVRRNKGIGNLPANSKDDKLLSLWYMSLALGIAATVVSLYSLYRYHKNTA